MAKKKLQSTFITRPTYLRMQSDIVAALMMRSPDFDATLLADQARVIVDSILKENNTTVRDQKAK